MKRRNRGGGRGGEKSIAMLVTPHERISEKYTTQRVWNEEKASPCTHAWKKEKEWKEWPRSD